MFEGTKRLSFSPMDVGSLRIVIVRPTEHVAIVDAMNELALFDDVVYPLDPEEFEGSDGARLLDEVCKDIGYGAMSTLPKLEGKNDYPIVHFSVTTGFFSIHLKHSRGKEGLQPFLVEADYCLSPDFDVLVYARDDDDAASLPRQ